MFINIYPAPTLGQALPRSWVQQRRRKLGEHPMQNQTRPPRKHRTSSRPQARPAHRSIRTLYHPHWATAPGLSCLWDTAQHLSAFCAFPPEGGPSPGLCSAGCSHFRSQLRYHLLRGPPRTYRNSPALPPCHEMTRLPCLLPSRNLLKFCSRVFTTVS